MNLGIIDDDANILYTVRAMAASIGCPIKTTSDPDECLGWVRDDAVDILLVDYHMPRMSGLEVVRRARQLSQKLIILVLTIEERSEVAKELLVAGADDFVTKPLRFADFSARISLHAELAKYRSEANWGDRGKGLSEETSRRVLALFEQPDTALTAAAVSESAKLAYPTAHRYLEHLVRKGLLQRRSVDEDGRSGRPRTSYSRTGAPR